MSKRLAIQDTADFDANNPDSKTEDFDVQNASSAVIWVKKTSGERQNAVLEISGSLITGNDVPFEFKPTGKTISPTDFRAIIDCSAYCFIKVTVKEVENADSILAICINSFE